MTATRDGGATGRPAGPGTGADPPAWRDAALPARDRVEALLSVMTRAEKLGQLGSRWVGNDMADAAGDAGATSPGATAPPPPNPSATATEHRVAPMQDVFSASGTVPLEVAARAGLGHLTRVYGSRPVSASAGAAEVLRQQRVVVAASRHGIPAVVHEECLTGFTAYGATVYPAAIAWAATWDPVLVEKMAAAIGADMAALGVHQGLAPVLDVVRDYRWGRVEETMGEDPHLVATLGTAYVRGLQGSGVVATLKHFAGYSAARAARNHGPVSIGPRELYDVVLPPFETAVRLGGAGSVMNSYSDLDGVPAGASEWLLTEVLREQWGFEGTVVSDYWAVPFLASMHRVASDVAAAGALALRAGIDVELPDTQGYGEGLEALVAEGSVPEELLDRAVRRALRAKVELGLLDDGWTPEASVASADEVDLDSPENRALARTMAERSVVLLDRGSALPLRGPDRPALTRVAVVGPCADDARTFMGCYAFPNHVLPRYPDAGLGISVPTALTALRTELEGVQVVHAPGCSVTGQERSGFATAVEAARGADVCIAMVGDLAGLFGHGSSGEGCDAEDLRLPGVQEDLLQELLATDTPVVVVVVSGRPYALGAVAGRAAGLVQAFFPGEEGAAAIAGVLSGRLCPGGKLPVQIPRRPGGQPATYLQPPLGGPESAGITSIDSVPLFAFGHGESYTRFEVTDVVSDTGVIETDGEVVVSARLRNLGARAGDEVLQLYLHDPVAQVARPVRQLIGFARVGLGPGEAAEVRWRVYADRTAYTSPDMRRIVEPGEIELVVGTSVAQEHGRVAVRLSGTTRVVGHDRRLDTPVRVHPVGAGDLIL